MGKNKPKAKKKVQPKENKGLGKKPEGSGIMTKVKKKK